MASSPKILLVFCDGTGMDGSLVDQKYLESNGPPKSQYPTNVLRLSRAIQPYSVGENPKRQIVYYQSGVGSESDFNGESVLGSTTLKALGTAVASKIRDAYAFLAQNYDEGDEICLFGFSRGAYTARKLAGLIDAIGLLERRSLGHLFKIWGDLNRKWSPVIPPGTRKPRIKCVGVWDTVGSVYNQIDALNIKDKGLLPSVDIALHALSLQENRDKFLPTLWDKPKGPLDANQVFKQIWFPGAHSDVGGGYERHELADLALFWMVGEIKSFINIDTNFIKRSGQANPVKWGTPQPHNSYLDLGWKETILIGHETRWENGLIKKDDLFHASIKDAPTKLDKPKYMITLNDLKQGFGRNWEPNCPPLNEFEKQCRDNWKMQHTNGAANSIPGEVKFDEESDLFTGWNGNDSLEGPLQLIAIKYQDGRYMKANESGDLAFDDHPLDISAQFFVFYTADDKINLKALGSGHKFLKMTDLHIRCDTDSILDSSDFEIVEVDNGSVHLTISAAGEDPKFVSCESGENGHAGSLVVKDSADLSCTLFIERLPDLP